MEMNEEILSTIETITANHAILMLHGDGETLPQDEVLEVLEHGDVFKVEVPDTVPAQYLFICD